MKPGLAILPLEVWADVFLSPWFTRQELAQFYNNIKDRGFANKLEKLLHDCGQQTMRYIDISSKESFEPEKCKYQLRKRKTPYHRASLTVFSGYSEYEPYGEYFQVNHPLSCMDCEFPEVQMPKNLKNFKQILISFLDDQVLDFLARIKPLFTNVVLRIHIYEYSVTKLRTFFGLVLPMIGSIHQINGEDVCIPNLDKHFPGTLARAKELDFCASPASIPACLNWLNTPLIDGDGPRFLKISGDAKTISAWVDAVRKQFLEAISSSTFVVFLHFFRDEWDHYQAEELTIENAATKEELTIRNAIFEKPKGYDWDFHYVEILRHPAGASVKMREWVKQRAYHEKEFGDQCEAEPNRMICISSPTFGHITKNRKGAVAMNQGEYGDDQSADDDEDDANGPSTSTAKKIKK